MEMDNDSLLNENKEANVVDAASAEENIRRIRLVVSYDGTNYHGWQAQPNAVTVEGTVEKALSDLLGRESEVTGASRTDAGVHAMGNVCIFDTDSRIPAEKFRDALNVRLPEDIRIVKSDEVDGEFHPRFDALEKTYEYRITRADTMPPSKRLYSTLVYKKLDVSLMRQAASYIVGKHDFAAFQSTGSTIRDTVRTVFMCEVEEEGADLVIRVRGDGFLYNMVRIIAGTLIDVGLGRMKPERVKQAVSGKSRELAGPTAPAKGLTLVEIEYDE